QDADLDAPVLRQPAFGDVEFRHELQPRSDGCLQFARRLLLIEQDAIHAEPDAEFLVERLDMNVAGALLDRLGNHGVHQADDWRRNRGDSPSSSGADAGAPSWAMGNPSCSESAESRSRWAI